MAIVTLLSDFGVQDATAAIAKGILLKHIQAGAIVDISHEITPFNKAEAAYIFGAACKNFSAGTCHVLLFDLFADATPRLILSEYTGQYFLSPDNGLLPLALGTLPENSWLCYELNDGNGFIDWMNAVAGIINQLKARPPGELGLPVWTLKESEQIAPPLPGPDGIACEVIHIDHYGNVIINITKEQFDAIGMGRQFRIEFVQVEEINELNNYHDVRAGYKLCRFNSNGFLEICINRGKAATLFGLKTGGKKNNIKLIFE